MNYLKPCKNCNSMERYKNGSCKPCAYAKQMIRNREGMLQTHLDVQKRNKQNNNIKEKARKNSQVHYASLTACMSCGETIRYMCNGACIGCN